MNITQLRRAVARFIDPSCREESNLGHRQSGQGLGSAAGAALDASAAFQAAINAAAGKTGTGPRVVTEEILAERAWDYASNADGLLMLLSINGTAWDGPTLVAHEKPTTQNTSGVYALRRLVGTEYQYHVITGTVALSGCVVEGEKGYRAERATIRSLKFARYHQRTAEPDGIMPYPHFDQWPTPEIIAALERRYATEVSVG